jgi:thiamine biosynthesis lipoprotein
MPSSANGSDRVPDAASVAATQRHVGWHRIQWRNPILIVPPDMELDFGGIGKEYAVDRCAQLCRQRGDANVLINYGGDIYISGPRRGDQAWIVGIDDPYASGKLGADILQLRNGGVATSGDARRFLLKDGVRYGHILDPETGWPVRGAPRSVTVVANSCIEAGMLATFAMLQGRHAERFLQEQEVIHRCIW